MRVYMHNTHLRVINNKKNPSTNVADGRKWSGIGDGNYGKLYFFCICATLYCTMSFASMVGSS